MRQISESAPRSTAPARSRPPSRAAAGSRLVEVLFGRRLRTDRERHERLSNPVALAVFASDALSSVAYATEEMLRVLLPLAAVAAYGFLVPLSGGIAVLLAALVLSYRQTIRAYPSAGGAYVVTRDNFGLLPAQVAGGALLTDYILTVAVSVSAGVAAIYSAFPAFYPYRVGMACSFVILLAWANLRGIRESGRLFALPTYGFVLAILTLIGVGGVRALTGQLQPLAVQTEALPTASAAGSVGLFVLLHAYASGSTAMTGVEAISNGVSAFKPVEWANARRVLTTLGVLLGMMFLGISFLASQLQPVIDNRETVLSQLGRAVLDSVPAGHAGFLFLQTMTMAILVLAANTAFADFPRLANFQAQDRFLPAPLTRLGRRLVFSNGIIVLAFAAIGLIVLFQASVDRLIPLYAIGVFTSFTLSQAGMARRHLRLREPGWRTGLAVNGAGALATAVVLVVIAVTKFVHGAWAILLVVPLLVGMFVRINRHYEHLQAIATSPDVSDPSWWPSTLEAVVLVDRLDQGLDRAMCYVDQLNPNTVRAVHVGRESLSLAAAFWARYGRPLEFEPRQGSTVRAARSYVRRLRQQSSQRALAVIVPEVVDGHSWLPVLRHNRVLGLKAGLLFEQDVMVINVPTRDDDALFGQLPLRHTVIVPIGDLHPGTRAAVHSAALLGATDIVAIHIAEDRRHGMRLLSAWADSGLPIPLEVVDSPYRDVDGPLLEEIRERRANGSDLITVVLGELVPRWWQHGLHSHHALELKAALLFEPGVAVASVPRRL
ncbi:MAG: APC family permease [Egibacteraceae bacterium]